ncbi:TPA: cysteine protease [Staphylococcus aureus]|nr:cysteine protease [Staphylococcus aureus]
MKRNFPKLIALSLILSLSVTPIANAESNSNIKAKDKKHVQVNVEDKSVPTDVRNLAQKDYLSYVTSLDKIYNKEKASYTLGEPFKIYKFNKKSDGNYYFPVLNTEGNIDYIVTISPKVTKYSSSSSKYTINVSPFLSKVLNQYKDQQITILTNSKGYYVVTQNHKAKLVLKTPRLEDKKLKKTESIPTGNNVTQLKQKASVTMPTSQFKSNNYTYNEQYVNKLENFKIRETQGNILHPNLQGQRFQFTGLTPREMIYFGQTQGRSPQLLNRMTTYNEVDNLTKNNKGIAVLGSRVESRNVMHAGHAMAVVGNAKLDNGQEVIIIWNPWDNGFMTQDAKNNVIPVSNGDHYRWYSSIYGY